MGHILHDMVQGISIGQFPQGLTFPTHFPHFLGLHVAILGFSRLPFDPPTAEIRRHARAIIEPDRGSCWQRKVRWGCGIGPELRAVGRSRMGGRSGIPSQHGGR